MADITHMEHKGFTVELRSDSLWFTVYDSYGEPCGTIERPGQFNKTWNAAVPTGEVIKRGAVGPRQCLRCIAIYHGA
jgi:hypothetical protein